MKFNTMGNNELEADVITSGHNTQSSCHFFWFSLNTSSAVRLGRLLGSRCMDSLPQGELEFMMSKPKSKESIHEKVYYYRH